MADAFVAGLLLATDPHGFGGMAVRCRAGEGRDRYLAWLRTLLPDATAWRRLPPGVAIDSLGGGLDLAATLATHRPVRHAGLLSEADGGFVLVPMAERLAPVIAARLEAALDKGFRSDDGRLERIGVLALDESVGEEALASGLADRIAFHIDLDAAGTTSDAPDIAPAWLARMKWHAAEVTVSEEHQSALAAATLAFGIDSARPAIATLRASRTLAAMAERTSVAPAELARAARLVLAPRATRIPSAPEDEHVEGPRDPPPEPQPDANAAPGEGVEAAEGAEETVRAAIKAALPPGLLLAIEGGGRAGRQAPGRAGALQRTPNQGRPVGVRRGMPTGGARLDLVATLRAAAPWQPLRRGTVTLGGHSRRVEIRRDDLRLTRFKRRSETVTLFVVDASGSLALLRLAEVKGAVELLLAECYVRRDQVALMAFRGAGADLLLPPTRSLARAKRSLAGLAGGGPTPLASALDATVALADGIRRRGRTPLVVVITDGRANVTRAGTVERAQAQAEAEQAARAAAATKLRILLVDAAPRPQTAARALAQAMKATYVPLPRADAAGLTRAVQQAAAN